MNLDTATLLTAISIITPILTVASGYAVVRHEVLEGKRRDEKTENRIEKIEEKMEAIRDLAMRAHGAYDTLGARIGTLEASVREMRDDWSVRMDRFEQAAEARSQRLEEMITGFTKASRRAAREADDRISNLGDRVGELDKSKVSTEKFERVVTGQHHVISHPRDRVTPHKKPIRREEQDSEAPPSGDESES